MIFRLTAVVALTSAIAAGCSSSAGATRADSIRADSIARARQDSINRAQPGYVIDSALTVEEELRRFRAAIGGTPVTQLRHASDSRDELVRRIVGDVVRGDSIDLRSAQVSAREFADLIYPSSPYTKPPYRQAPGFVWSQIQHPSATGFARLLKRREGTRVGLAGYSCKPEPDKQGANRLWLDCQLRLVGGRSDTSTQRWFGTIVERGGLFKVMSYTNQF